MAVTLPFYRDSEVQPTYQNILSGTDVLRGHSKEQLEREATCVVGLMQTLGGRSCCRCESDGHNTTTSQSLNCRFYPKGG